MLFKALSAAVYGIDANILDVEVAFSGIQTQEDDFHTAGLFKVESGPVRLMVGDLSADMLLNPSVDVK